MTAIWAHRGASAYAPENTMPAFELALKMGSDGLELDVQRTKDGHLVVIHDETINRTSNGFGKVVDQTLDELRGADFSHGFPGRRNTKIPLLRDVFDLVKGTDAMVNVELKNSIELYPGIEDDALKLAKDAGVLDQTLFSSFNHYGLANLRGKVSPQHIALLFADGLYEPWQYAHWFGAGVVHPNYLALRHPEFVWLCHERNVKVNVWTVNKDEDALWLAGMGVDGIITNFPDRVGETVRRGYL
ncbi:MAG: glycerophosphodiester phosphodiesterase [Propionibacteriaceae bacterium]|nr:glycerophosphodiester phosphodiesterase [Propionibacteriaceae bacterium]